MKLTSALIKEIALSVRGNEPVGFSAVHTDSREKSNNSLFIPIVGERFDGHEFLASAIKNGATGAIWQQNRKVPADIPANFPLYFVNDSLEALQSLATAYLNKVAPIVIGITGSNGKTSTKDIVDTVLSKKYVTHKTAGNYNNHIGLPLSILAMEPNCELIVLEMGMSGLGEISLLSRIAEPHYAIVTNIGESHIEQLGSRKGIAQAKMEIVDGLKTTGKVFIDGDEPLLKPYETKQTVLCGYSEHSMYQITNIDGNESGFTFQLNNSLPFYQVPLLGRHNVKNATYAIALAKELALQESVIKEALQSVHLTGMRLEKTKAINGSMIINDAYNASPTSMKAAIEAVKDLNGFAKKILILGDMYELGTDEELLHRSVAEAVSAPITHVFTVGEKGKWISDELQARSSNTMVVNAFNKKEEVVPTVKNLLTEDTIVLLKASRGMKLETIMTDLVEGERGEKHC